MMPDDTLANLWKYRPPAYVRWLVSSGRKTPVEMLEALMDGMSDAEIREALVAVSLDPETVLSVEWQR
jgi:hypothetical protein